jgi:hypothetical protein
VSFYTTNELEGPGSRRINVRTEFALCMIRLSKELVHEAAESHDHGIHTWVKSGHALKMRSLKHGCSKTMNVVRSLSTVLSIWLDRRISGHFSDIC